MTAQSTEDTTPVDGEQEERYAELSLEDGVVIYDREHHPAWIQAGDTVSLEEMQ